MCLVDPVARALTFPSRALPRQIFGGHLATTGQRFSTNGRQVGKLRKKGGYDGRVRLIKLGVVVV